MAAPWFGAGVIAGLVTGLWLGGCDDRGDASGASQPAASPRAPEAAEKRTTDRTTHDLDAREHEPKRRRGWWAETYWSRRAEAEAAQAEALARAKAAAEEARRARDPGSEPSVTDPAAAAELERMHEKLDGLFEERAELEAEAKPAPAP